MEGGGEEEKGEDERREREEGSRRRAQGRSERLGWTETDDEDPLQRTEKHGREEMTAGRWMCCVLLL